MYIVVEELLFSAELTINIISIEEYNLRITNFLPVGTVYVTI